MTSGFITTLLGPRYSDSEVRLRLKPQAPATGYVDGSWWPRSRDLVAELPALLAAVHDQLGRTESVSYHLGDWDPTDRRTEVDGSTVRLAGFRFQKPDTVDLLGRHGRITLLVVPPGTDPHAADVALVTASRRGNTDTVDALLHSPTDRNPS
jgi:hypothetical protein